MKKIKSVYKSTFGEEVGNTISHGIMAMLALFAIPFASVWAYISGSNSLVYAFAVSVFAISIFLMLLVSTLYHAMHPLSKHKAIFQILDHIFIYVAIAGSYTPIALLVIGGWQGVLITALQWAMVIFGIFYKSLSSRSIPALSLSIYFIMSWSIVFFMPLLLRSASTMLLVLIAVGGLFYMLGAYFYAKKGFRYHHLVWHIFIDFAVLAHFAAIVFYLY